MNVRHKSDGRSSTLPLQEGSYWIGNGIGNDICLRAKGGRVKLLLNVQRDKLLITVLKGSIRMNTVTYKSNEKEQIVVPEQTKVFIEDFQLQFVRERVRNT